MPCKKLDKNYNTISTIILKEMPKLVKKVKSGAGYNYYENFFQPNNKELNLCKLKIVI